jgi:hypothetical protein
MPRQNALERYRKIMKVKLVISLIIALALVLVGAYYLLAARP